MLSIPAKRISFTRRSCRVPKSRDTSFRLRTVCRDPFDAQFPQGSSELRERFFSAQLFREGRGTAAMAKDAVLIGVMRQWSSVALQPVSQRSQVLFRGVTLHQAGPQPAGGVIDHGDQLASRAAFLPPTKRGAILHYQLSKTGPPFAPHMDGLPALGTGTPQRRPGHPLPQGFTTYHPALLGQVFGDQGGPEVRISLTDSRQDLLLQRSGQFAVRPTAAQPVNHTTIATLANGQKQPPN